MSTARVRRHLGPDGRLVLTTPNPFYAVHFVEFLLSAAEARWNGEHVAWICAFTLGNLLARRGLELDQCVYFTRSRRLRQLLRLLHLPCPRWLASTLVVVAKPAREEAPAQLRRSARA
ncbi:MAG TPA: hypothetical protein VNF74_11950 [Terriglobales bacterium]|nr:hypothetical protein [Terriglobales bacterium]